MIILWVIRVILSIIKSALYTFTMHEVLLYISFIIDGKDNIIISALLWLQFILVLNMKYYYNNKYGTYEKFERPIISYSMVHFYIINYYYYLNLIKVIPAEKRFASPGHKSNLFIYLKASFQLQPWIRSWNLSIFFFTNPFEISYLTKKKCHPKHMLWILSVRE